MGSYCLTASLHRRSHTGIPVYGFAVSRDLSRGMMYVQFVLVTKQVSFSKAIPPNFAYIHFSTTVNGDQYPVSKANYGNKNIIFNVLVYVKYRDHPK